MFRCGGSLLQSQLRRVVSYFSAGEVSPFKTDKIILNSGLLGSCSQVSSPVLRKGAREVAMGGERRGVGEEREREKERRGRERAPKCLEEPLGEGKREG